MKQVWEFFLYFILKDFQYLFIFSSQYYTISKPVVKNLKSFTHSWNYLSQTLKSNLKCQTQNWFGKPFYFSPLHFIPILFPHLSLISAMFICLSSLYVVDYVLCLYTTKHTFYLDTWFLKSPAHSMLYETIRENKPASHSRSQPKNY